ncbi:MAG TPA: NAD(P)H-binding protein [Mycobacterium sp.]|nr:NAD(P)H-binding protein [Mycobacterium sp.]
MAIVVTGATGNVGRPLVEELVAAGAEVRAVSRRPEAAGFPPEVKVVDSVVAAIPGASAVFLNSRALGEDMAPTVRLARQQGVGRLVALSAINADDDFSRQPSRYRGDRNKEVEQLAIDTGLPWVSLRPSVFATNFAGMWGGQIQAGDVVSGPYASAASAPIVESDIAAVAARALTSDDLLGQRIPLTGPRSLTNIELVEVIGSVLGRPLRYNEVPVELVRQRFVNLGFPPEFGDAYIAMLATTVDRPAEVTDGVARILGRPAQSWMQWVTEHKSLFSQGS